MRINKFIAQSSMLSRRSADAAIAAGRVTVNDEMATSGSQVEATDTVYLDGVKLEPKLQTTTILFYKPEGYVCSRNGQGSATIYDILPAELQRLNPIGRLDKDSSGLLLLTDDGATAQQLSHPKYQKTKVYEVTLNYPLQPLTRQIISDKGVQLEDGRSQFLIERIRDDDDTTWRIIMHEGRNRQIRRTFAALGFTVTQLHRTHFGPYSIEALKPGQYKGLQSLE